MPAILVTDDSADKTFSVQVKPHTGRNFWLVRDVQVAPRDMYVFVRFRDNKEPSIDYYIVPSQIAKHVHNDKGGWSDVKQ